MTTGPILPGPDDEPGADQLRSVLATSAAGVQPRDGSLGTILTRANRRSAWSWGAPLLAAAAALVIVAGIGVYASTRGASTAQPGSHSPSPSTTGPSPSPSTSSSPTGTGPAVALPVYYAGSYGGTSLLYREFHAVRTTTRGQTAAEQVLSTPPLDPDYRTLWPTGTKLLSYTQAGSTVTLSLSQVPTSSLLALQQMVYTITGADTSVRRVTFTGPGLALHLSQTRDTAIDTLAPVWLLQPTQDATVASPVTLSGVAMVFEATVNWEVDTTDGTMVQQGSAMTPQAFVQGPWSVTVTLPPGQYVAKAYAASAKDGSKTWIDSKPFTVH
jgi:hypothetical protein